MGYPDREQTSHRKKKQNSPSARHRDRCHYLEWYEIWLDKCKAQVGAAKPIKQPLFITLKAAFPSLQTLHSKPCDNKLISHDDSGDEMDNSHSELAMPVRGSNLTILQTSLCVLTCLNLWILEWLSQMGSELLKHPQPAAWVMWGQYTILSWAAGSWPLFPTYSRGPCRLWWWARSKLF